VISFVCTIIVNYLFIFTLIVLVTLIKYINFEFWIYYFGSPKVIGQDPPLLLIGKKWLYQGRKKKKRSKRWTRSQTNSEWNIIQRFLLKQSSHNLFGPLLSFTSIPPSLGHNTSLIKSTQIKDWLLSFEGFNLEENFDLLTGLF